MSYVYFIGTHTKDGVRIKIGVTGQAPEARRRNLQCGSATELVLMAYAPGSRDLEQFLHRAFDDTRDIGEWFRPSRRLLNVIGHMALVRADDGFVERRDFNAAWQAGAVNMAVPAI